MTVPYRLGIDVGTNSLGWCLLRLDETDEPCGLLDIGVRIFKDARDPKNKASLAATRRGARAMRRQRDRRLQRKAKLLAALTRHGLMPADRDERKPLECLDPYELRARGLDERLSPYELGRALFHLNQRRGFQSNLKADRKEKSRVTREPREKLAAILGEYRTLGEFLHKRGVGRVTRQLDGKALGEQSAVRFRPHMKGAKVEYDLYPTRAMYRDEFEKLWEAQRRFCVDLPDGARAEIADAQFHQRDLKPVPVGKCTFEPNDTRAPRELPIAQRFRVLQDVNNLEWIDRERRSHRLEEGQRQKIVRLLERQKTVGFDKMRKVLGLGSEVRFNLESDKRKDLKGDQVAYVMADEKRFGDRWREIPFPAQNAIIERWLDLGGEDDEIVFSTWLESEFALSPEQSKSVIDAPLPGGHVRLGRVAIGKLLPRMEAGKRFHEAATEMYGDHARLPTGEIFDALPYYGERLGAYTAEVPSASDPKEREFGRLANPTVHVALNQLRRVVNELIQRHGHPDEIVIELARELPLGKEDRLERDEEQKNNQDRNEALRGEIESLLRGAGAPESEVQSALRRGDALLRMRLWKELGKPPDTLCPYTLTPIGIRMLFSHEVHLEHILPFRRTHDDSYANKTVCLRRANDIKLEQTPWEAFHGNTAGYDWERILLQSTNLPKNKQWRFAEDAIERLKRLDRFGMPRELADQFTEENAFLARHLIDTQYIARVTREYLTMVCNPYRVWPITGGTTALLRGKWNLSALLPRHNIGSGEDEKRAPKSRLDHRHHAIDAFVVACTSRSMLQRIASSADDRRERLIEKMPDPWSGFRDELREGLRGIVVSFRSDHGSAGVDPATGRSRTTGALHKDTAYFPVSEPGKDGASEVETRRVIASFETMAEIESILDRPLRDALKAFVEEKLKGGGKFTDACAAFAEETKIRKVRMRERLRVIPIRDRAGRVYKAYKGDSNDYMEIWRLPTGAWTGQAISTFDANQHNRVARARPHPAAKLLMKLYNDDLIRLVDDSGTERTMRVVKTSKQTVVLADHFESGNLKDRNDGTSKAKKAIAAGTMVPNRDSKRPPREPNAVLAETGGFEYLSRAVSKLPDLQFRKIHVSPAGRVSDPGPPR